MHRMPMSGIFELFVPGVKPGDAYRYEIKARGDVLLQKADPYGNRTQPAPAWNSVVEDVTDFQWKDDKWMADRKKYNDRKQPVSIYETSLGQWKDGKKLIRFVKRGRIYPCGSFIRLWNFLGRIQMDIPTSAYFAVSTRYGTPAEFAALIDELHQEEIWRDPGLVTGSVPKICRRPGEIRRNPTLRSERIRIWQFTLCRGIHALQL